MKYWKSIWMLLIACLAFSTTVWADSSAQNKLVIQVSTDDLRTQTVALNNVVNVQKMYGMDDVEIELVAYGPGLGLLTEGNPLAKRVTSLALQNVIFTACGNTMKTVERKTGKIPQLLEGVEQTLTGVARIMELQQQGYAYIRP